MFFVFFLRTVGFGFSILAALLVTLFIPLFPELITWHDPKGFLAIFIVGFAVTGMVGLPGFLIATLYQSRYPQFSIILWVGVGMVTALFANCLFAILISPMVEFMVFNSSLAGGAAGGFVYAVFHKGIIFHNEDLRVITSE